MFSQLLFQAQPPIDLPVSRETQTLPLGAAFLPWAVQIHRAQNLCFSQSVELEEEEEEEEVAEDVRVCILGSQDGDQKPLTKGSAQTGSQRKHSLEEVESSGIVVCVRAKEPGCVHHTN